MSICCESFTLTSACHTVSLNMPIWGGEDKKINKSLARFQFWTDNYAVHDTGIESQPLILNGIDVSCGEAGFCFPLCFPMDTAMRFDAAWINKFIYIHEMADNHEEVTITGLGQCIDAVYIIKDFRLDTIPMHGISALSWSLTLELVRGI